MKIVYFYQYFATSKGSWGTRVYEFARNWVAQGHDVTVVSAVYSKSDLKVSKLLETQYHDGIRVKVVNVLIDNKRPIPQRIAAFLKYTFFSSWYALTLPADVVIASSGPITVGIPGLVARYLRGRKLVFEARDLWPSGAVELGIIRNSLMVRLAYWFEKRCYAAATHIVTLSPGMSDDIRRRYGYDKQTTVTNAANIALFSRQVNTTTPFSGKKYAIYTGNIGEVNNSRWLLNAARELKRKGREDIIILLIGEGQWRETLEEEARVENIINFVRLGLMPKEDLVPYIQQSMVSLVPLKGTPVLDTSSPNKFFESLAAGVPVVQNTNGWMKDFLEEHKVGFTIPPDDAAGLADLLIRLCEDKEMLKDMGWRGQALARECFDKDVLSAKMLKVLTDVHNAS
jgi:glycosyltransferase involved in cell wall biosynthesis